MNLISFLGGDKENLGQITALINRGEWDSVFLVKYKGTADIQTTKPYKAVEVSDSDLLSLKKNIQDKLKPLLSNDFEVALSLAPGTGKEHMALISALLSIPVGVKIVAFTKNGIEFVS